MIPMRVRVEDVANRLRRDPRQQHNQLLRAARVVRIHNDQVVRHLDDSRVAVTLARITLQEPDSRHNCLHAWHLGLRERHSDRRHEAQKERATPARDPSPLPTEGTTAEDDCRHHQYSLHHRLGPADVRPGGAVHPVGDPRALQAALRRQPEPAQKEPRRPD